MIRRYVGTKPMTWAWALSVGLDALEDIGRGGADAKRHSVGLQDNLMRRRLVRKAAHRSPQVSSITGQG